MAVGGGGLAMEPGDALLDGFMLSLARRERPRICFLGTASGDSERYVASFYRACVDHDCCPTDLALFNRKVVDLRRYLLEQDVDLRRRRQHRVAAGGVARARPRRRAARGARRRRRAGRRERRHELLVRGLDHRLLRRRHSSRSTTAWASWPAARARTTTARAQRRPLYHRLVAAGFPSGWAADDGAALHFDAAVGWWRSSRRGRALAATASSAGPTAPPSSSRCPRATCGDAPTRRLMPPRGRLTHGGRGKRRGSRGPGETREDGGIARVTFPQSPTGPRSRAAPSSAS